MNYLKCSNNLLPTAYIYIFFNLCPSEFSLGKKAVFHKRFVIKTKAKLNHMRGLHAIRIVAMCADNVDSSLALQKDM